MIPASICFNQRDATFPQFKGKFMKLIQHLNKTKNNDNFFKRLFKRSNRQQSPSTIQITLKTSSIR